MSNELKTVSIAPEHVAGRAVDNVAAVGTDLIGVVALGVSSEPSEPKQDETEKDAKEKKS